MPFTALDCLPPPTHRRTKWEGNTVPLSAPTCPGKLNQTKGGPESSWGGPVVPRSTRPRNLPMSARQTLSTGVPTFTGVGFKFHSQTQES